MEAIEEAFYDADVGPDSLIGSEVDIGGIQVEFTRPSWETGDHEIYLVDPSLRGMHEVVRVESYYYGPWNNTVIDALTTRLNQYSATMDSDDPMRLFMLYGKTKHILTDLQNENEAAGRRQHENWLNTLDQSYHESAEVPGGTLRVRWEADAACYVLFGPGVEEDKVDFQWQQGEGFLDVPDTVYLGPRRVELAQKLFRFAEERLNNGDNPRQVFSHLNEVRFNYPSLFWETQEPHPPLRKRAKCGADLHVQLAYGNPSDSGWSDPGSIKSYYLLFDEGGGDVFTLNLEGNVSAQNLQALWDILQAGDRFKSDDCDTAYNKISTLWDTIQSSPKSE